MSNLVNISVPQFPLLYIRCNNRDYLVRFGVFNKLMPMMHSKHNLTHSNGQQLLTTIVY